MCLFVFLAYNNDAFVQDGTTTMATFLLFFIYGLAAIPLSYIISFAFENHTSAQVGISGIHFVTGFILTIASFIMATIESTAATNESLKPYYRLLPPYNLGEGLISLSTRQLEALLAGRSSAAFGWEVIGRNLTYLIIESVVYFIITLAIDAG
jgi:ATP-binding cassette subfamily A (ABC1) protein 3